MRKTHKSRQPWPGPYKRLLIEVFVVLLIWNVAQGNQEHIHMLIRLLTSLS